MEELIMYATDLMCELDEIQEETDTIVAQRIELMNQWGNRDVDHIEIGARIQALDSILSTNYKLMSENYAELKRIDKELGLCMAEAVADGEDNDDDLEEDY